MGVGGECFSSHVLEAVPVFGRYQGLYRIGYLDASVTMSSNIVGPFLGVAPPSDHWDKSILIAHCFHSVCACVCSGAGGNDNFEPSRFAFRPYTLTSDD